MDTNHSHGDIHKTAVVKTNDPDGKEVRISIIAYVRVAISFPAGRHVSMYGAEGQIITKVVDVQSQLEKPLVLTPSAFTLEGKVKYTLEEIEKGRRFKVTFTSIPGTAQTYRGQLKLKTNYPENPEITIEIMGRFGSKSQGMRNRGASE